MSVDFCTYEDREEDFIAQKLLVQSMQFASPTCRLHIPVVGLTGDQLRWLRDQPNVKLLFEYAPRAKGWDIKPDLMGHLLDSGLARVTWIDSDIIVTRDVDHLFEGIDSRTLMSAQEGHRTVNVGTLCRARALGLPPGRELGWDICSAFVSATPRHRELLEDWAALMQRPDYIENQGKISRERAFHLSGDQELLSGLLGSAKYANVPVRRITSGRDIAHCQAPHFYPLGARLGTLFRGEPPLVHSQAAKPWRGSHVWKSNPLSRPISLYVDFAGMYVERLQDDPGSAFLRPRRANAKHPSLRRLDEGLWGTTRLILGKAKNLMSRSNFTVLLSALPTGF